MYGYLGKGFIFQAAKLGKQNDLKRITSPGGPVISKLPTHAERWDGL
jgi:hypothetical protein